ncbi:hypothetical protein EC9793_03833 [Escherichia coli O145:H28]|nr:hypothetical protein EC9793_03833 [Escherichia coli O145:H28]
MLTVVAEQAVVTKFIATAIEQFSGVIKDISPMVDQLHCITCTTRIIVVYEDGISGIAIDIARLLRRHAQLSIFDTQFMR